ncbi:MAG TPA: type II secretion system protein GspN [Bdellovibrionales bacterium]|nr:type II secretion system protein GspN [Bdellovibrionales bacterium]
MNGLITGFFNIFRFHKLKIATGVLAFLFFLVVLFPFDDLSDLVTAQVAAMTQNQIFLQFSDPGLSLFPSPGLQLNDVYVETPFAPPLKASQLSVSPSLASLLAGKSGVALSAEDLLGGDISVSAYSSTTKESKLPSQKITFDASDVDLAQIAQVAGIPIQFKGRIDIDSDAEIELTFKDQPAVKLALKGNKIQVPPDMVPTTMGPLPLPDLSFSVIEFDGELKGGKLTIENGKLGSEKDDLNGTIKGLIDLTITNSGGRPAATVGGYDVQLRLNAKESIEKKLTLLDIVCGSTKKKAGGTISYPCGLSAPNTMVPPKARTL